MPISARTAASLAVILALIWVTQSWGAGEISEITATPDGRRIAIKSDSRIGSHTAHVQPPKLVIDIAETGVSRLPRITGLAKESSLDVRAARTPSGARVVFNFGNGGVPDHKILRMDNYLLVFLDQKPPQTVSGIKPLPQRPAPREGVSLQAVTPNKGAAVTAVTAGASELSIQSADVEGGLIVLKVANRATPARVYRIELGVDFRQLGFSTARISPVPEIASASQPPNPVERPKNRMSGPKRSVSNPIAVSAKSQPPDALPVPDAQ